MDAFSETKNRLTMSDVARRYGYEPNRAGYICCPFHSEKTASMKLYEKQYHCYGCGAHGSVIDFVANIHNLSPLDAVKRLDDDFHLGLEYGHVDLSKHVEDMKVLLAKKRFEEWREAALYILGECIRKANRADTADPSDEESLAIRFREALEEWQNDLQSADLERQIRVFRDRRGVGSLCRRILESTLTRF